MGSRNTQFDEAQYRSRYEHLQCRAEVDVVWLDIDLRGVPPKCHGVEELWSVGSDSPCENIQQGLEQFVNSVRWIVIEGRWLIKTQREFDWRKLWNTEGNVNIRVKKRKRGSQGFLSKGSLVDDVTSGIDVESLLRLNGMIDKGY